MNKVLLAPEPHPPTCISRWQLSWCSSQTGESRQKLQSLKRSQAGGQPSERGGPSGPSCSQPLAGVLLHLTGLGRFLVPALLGGRAPLRLRLQSLGVTLCRGPCGASSRKVFWRTPSLPALAPCTLYTFGRCRGLFPLWSVCPCHPRSLSEHLQGPPLPGGGRG